MAVSEWASWNQQQPNIQHVNREKEKLPRRCWPVFEVQKRWSLVLGKGNVPDALASSSSQLVSLSGYSFVFVPLSLTFVRKAWVRSCAYYCQGRQIRIRLVLRRAGGGPVLCPGSHPLCPPFYSNQLGEGVTPPHTPYISGHTHLLLSALELLLCHVSRYLLETI